MEAPSQASFCRDASTDSGRVLADARREHERINALQRRGQHSRIDAHPMHEVLDRKHGMRIVARTQLAHVIADA